MQDRNGLDNGAAWWCEHCSALLLAICIAYGSFRGMGRGKVLFYVYRSILYVCVHRVPIAMKPSPLWMQICSEHEVALLYAIIRGKS